MKYLRTLTEKSTIGFGKYSEMRVGEVLEIAGGPYYLSWVYYNCSMISFDEDILNRIGIFNKLLIEKPGKNPQMYEDVFGNRRAAFLWGHKGCSEHRVVKKRMRKNKKRDYVNFKVRDERTYSKKNMQSKNQGHF